MKQLPKTQPRHSIRITQAAYQLIHKLAVVRDQSDTLTLEQVINDYFKLSARNTA